MALPPHDRKQFYLLVVLYLLQGIPVGLTFGTIPFILKSSQRQTSFVTIGLFSMATYPYSFKILWSPIVDSWYSQKVGRRRSWIIPVQFVTGITLLTLGYCISKDKILPKDVSKVDMKALTSVFLFLVILCSTQDIAVDGWALNILSKESLSYASTAQTIGLNIGYFMSFTIFLSLSSDEFMQKYFHRDRLFQLSSYLTFTGLLYLAVTFYVSLFTSEKVHVETHSHIKKDDDEKMIEYQPDEEEDNESHDLINIYRLFIKVMKLPSVQTLAIVHLISKFAFQCNDAATNLKLLEKGLKREDLAITVLINFPFELLFGFYVARLSRAGYSFNNKIIRAVAGDARTLTPWIIGFIGRLSAAILGNVVVYLFPEDESEISMSFFLLVLCQHLLGSFMSTFQFVSMSAFHTQVADPVIGGTYMTLLNTLSNLGGTWPRLLIMSMIDFFSKYDCTGVPLIQGQSLTKEQCVSIGGQLNTIRDGYYITNLFCIVSGLLIFTTYLKPTAIKLCKVPLDQWKVSN
ncbi:uncharacterized protein KLLA0_F09581g [Kluyveromyces lactis]|uniref:KLLA0F09581p n=1 Tax=Kluyveromyces lactis (strain ATCC 8585 / CBS 2359 / DSM 70799 / NBRC 1267 / NRRL Y-1140 / WM37) TaxID=284590 RepID=Q6CKM4_KLULA|nr:uncharacterized protein KLLA0_F09581g [Kluyveromyces lactis]CAG98223.1 KLLA0F09581p [Kluyveromyces lactis]|eukprot:XP_455515.1 uncharacterized protein KLLA0_F09581g [Kluyveromyces lactis]